MPNRGRLVIACPDQPGIVASVSQFLFGLGANIVHSDQHSSDRWGGTFFLRLEFELEQFSERMAEVQAAFAPIRERFAMEARWVAAHVRPRIGVLVSKEEHCLLELMWDIRAGDLHAEIAVVIGNHPDLAAVVAPYGIPFRHIPVVAGEKAQAEQAQQAALAGLDLVVLAKYMQIVSPGFIANWPNRIINIHHSFLPAFVGAKPYAQAQSRGVKLIGASAHYVTEELDAGPIIEQDVARVDHRNDLAELKQIGRRVERAVLARAVRWHLEDRILVHGNRTVVFA
ncbi:MAG: formyltetrahydrofolate deformylase [Fimbriimonas sp.]